MSLVIQNCKSSWWSSCGVFFLFTSLFWIVKSFAKIFLLFFCSSHSLLSLSPLFYSTISSIYMDTLQSGDGLNFWILFFLRKHRNLFLLIFIFSVSPPPSFSFSLSLFVLCLEEEWWWSRVSQVNPHPSFSLSLHHLLQLFFLTSSPQRLDRAPGRLR